MNKNDLRFKKTEIAIKEAYFALKKNGKAVKVKDLCEQAMINKTTFYSHYETVDSLNRQVCSDLVSKILSECSHIKGIFTNTNEFVNELHTIFSKNQKIILNFYDNDVNSLVNDIEKELLKSYINDDTSVDLELAIRFCIGGAFRILFVGQSPEYISKTVYFIEQFIDSFPITV